MKKTSERAARRLIDELGICLVYPLANRPEPPSLFGAMHPKAKMSWSWDDGADARVVELWHLRARLAASHEVAYGKWLRGRATFFSLPVFHALLGRIAQTGDPTAGMPPEAHDILAILRERSPLSTKEIRTEAGLRGRPHERAFGRAMTALWSRLLVVGVGEVEDGAFPSLAVGATELIFEDLWSTRQGVPISSRGKLDAALVRSKAVEREHDRVLGELRAADRLRRTPEKRVYAYDDL